MKLLIDHADVNQIINILEYYPIDGVTTNPSILLQEGKNPYIVLSEIREMIGPEKEIHAQVISDSAENMVKEAKYIVERIGGNVYVKIPAVPEGFKAMMLLTNNGIGLTATAVYTPMQAYLAAKCGAAYVAPYVNRMDNMGYDGVQMVKTMQDIFNKNKMTTRILAASFKNSQQVMELAAYGIGASTVAPDVIRQFVANPAIFSAVAAFTADFEKLTASGKTMLDA
ncbi:MAG: fructose-6-phosphate aldolase [Clostridiales bacterium]|nr:fructose-6-phosphate aldolase [Clostridiales bacterium]